MQGCLFRFCPIKLLQPQSILFWLYLVYLRKAIAKGVLGRWTIFESFFLVKKRIVEL